MGQFIFSTKFRKKISDLIDASLKISPYIQLNEFEKTSSGETLSKGGMLESLDLSFYLGRISLNFNFYFSFDYLGKIWKNSYGHSQNISYEILEKVAIGFEHSISEGVIDSSTGFYSPFLISDSNKSKFSFVLNMEL